MTTKLPLLPNCGDNVAAIWWLLKVGRNCQIAATFLVAANSQSLLVALVAATIHIFSPEKMLKIMLGSLLMT
jgi:hypothetical protein